MFRDTIILPLSIFVSIIIGPIIIGKIIAYCNKESEKDIFVHCEAVPDEVEPDEVTEISIII